MGPRTSPIGALSDRSKETPNGGGSDFHKFMSQSNLVDNCPIQADLFHARYRPFGTTTDGITATQTVSITPRAVPAIPIVASTQALQTTSIDISGTASNAILPGRPRSGDTDWLKVKAGAALSPWCRYTHLNSPSAQKWPRRASHGQLL